MADKERTIASKTILKREKNLNPKKSLFQNKMPE